MIGRLLLWLIESHRAGADRYGPQLRTLHEWLLEKYHLASDVHVERLFIGRSRQAEDLVRQNQFVYLQPVDSQGPMLPILAVRFDFAHEPPLLSLQVALFRTMNEDQEVPNAVAFRFETAEGPGVHCYYHAQPVSRFRGSDDPRHDLPIPTWIPDSQPAFPIDANNPVALFVAMLVSLYGSHAARWLQENGYMGELNRYLEGTRFRC